MQDNSFIRESLLRMAGGAFEERIDREMSRVIENILDPNTKATEKRKITMEFVIQPDEERSTFSVNVTAKSKLATLHPVTTTLCMTSDQNGELMVAEMVPQIPGQLSVTGEEQTNPKLLKLLSNE